MDIVRIRRINVRIRTVIQEFTDRWLGLSVYGHGIKRGQKDIRMKLRRRVELMEGRGFDELGALSTP